MPLSILRRWPGHRLFETNSIWLVIGIIGAIAVGISLTAGLAVGLFAAYRRGWVESLLMRATDVLFSFTETLIALACVAVLGPSLQNAMIAVGVAGIPFYARTCHSAALVERLLATS